MSLDYPIQIAHTISDDEAGKLLRFQQTAVRGEKVYFSDTGNEYIALNDAGDRNGEFTAVADNATFAQFTTAETLPAIGDTVQIMNSTVAGYVGTHTVTASSGGTFTLDVAYSATGTGYWKREARVKKIISETYDADNINYTNTTSGLTATDVQDAIDELDNTLDNLSASDISYNNTTSLLSATDVQDALDEIVDDYTDGLFNLDTDLQGQLNDIRFPVSQTGLTATTTLDSFPHYNSKGTVKWLVQLDDTVTLRSSEIVANYNNTTVAFNEYGIIENGVGYVGATLSVDESGGNIRLLLTVTPATGPHSTNILRIAKW